MRGMRWLPRLARLASVGIAVAAASPGVSAGPSGRQAVRVGIALGGPAPVVARHAAAMVAETDALWRPRGVEVALIDGRPQLPGPHGSPGGGNVRLTLTFGSLANATPHPGGRPRGRTSEGRAGLGSIWFFEDGLPGDEIEIDEAAVRARLADARLNGRAMAEWPPALVDLVTDRALGRVLAHEIGHYLLASAAHAASGLMRPAFGGPELAGWDRGRFALDAGALPRLRARLAQLDRFGSSSFFVLRSPF